MKTIKIKFSVTLFLLLLLPFLVFAQIKKKTTAKKINTCNTYVYNLSTEEMRIRDICFYVTLTDHIDMNVYNPERKWDKKNDFWKFDVTIFDNQNLNKTNLNASFYVYEESSEIIQYHCLVEDQDIKAIIYDKSKKLWQILVLQNDNYKILSSYTGYHYTNAFGIKPKTKSINEY